MNDKIKNIIVSGLVAFLVAKLTTDNSDDKQKALTTSANDFVTIYESGNDYVRAWKTNNIVSLDLFIQDFTTDKVFQLPESFCPPTMIAPAASAGTGGAVSTNIAIFADGSIRSGVNNINV